MIKKKTFKRRSPRKFWARTSKVCRLCTEKVKAKDIDYKNVNLLQRYVTEHGKILPSRITGNCASHQRRISRAIKQAQIMALLPFTAE